MDTLVASRPVTQPPRPGPCAKQTTIATLITRDGQVHEGANWCRNAQEACPRVTEGYATGEGYHLCKEVCQQDGHAEWNALHRAAMSDSVPYLAGSKLYLTGHTYACRGCTALAKEFGVEIVITGKNP